MAPDKTGEPWIFHVFDNWAAQGSFSERYRVADGIVSDTGWTDLALSMVPNRTIEDAAALEAYEELLLSNGYEGVILRDPAGAYKYGRASATKGELLKLKRFEDFEAEVIGVYEEQHNANEKYTNELGRGQRSTAKAGLIGKGRLGGLILRGLNTGWEGVEFRCGTGFDHAQREALWSEAVAVSAVGGADAGLNGRVAKIKCFPVGVKDKPRHPVFLGWREAGA
jgi:DNA ligase-1